MTKLCGSCSESKPLESFPRDYRYQDGRTAAACKTCAARRTAKWKAANPDAYRESVRKRDPQLLRAAQKRWRDKNVEGERQRVAEYQRANPARCAATAGQRRAARAKAVPRWANRFFIGEAYDLARKRSEVTGVKHVVDHLVPLQSPLVCGLHVEHNLRVIPEAINARKGNRWWPDMPE